jgi:hypothetical protein
MGLQASGIDLRGGGIEPGDLFDASAIFFDPVMGFVTPNENIDTSDWTDMIPAVFIGAVAGAFLGPLAAQAAGFTSTIAAAGFGGAIGSAFSSMVATGRIDLKQVFKSALTAALTAGFAELTGANEAGLLTDARGNVVFIDGAHVVADWGARIASMGVQAAFNGLLSDLMGGDFSQGFVQSMASQLGREIMNGIRGEINNSSTPLTAQEQTAYTLMGRSISAALTIAANPGHPLQALALGFIGEIGAGLGTELGNVNPAANGVGNGAGGTANTGGSNAGNTSSNTDNTDWANTPINGLTEDDGWTLGISDDDDGMDSTQGSGSPFMIPVVGVTPVGPGGEPYVPHDQLPTPSKYILQNRRVDPQTGMVSLELPPGYRLVQASSGDGYLLVPPGWQPGDNRNIVRIQPPGTGSSIAWGYTHGYYIVTNQAGAPISIYNGQQLGMV